MKKVFSEDDHPEFIVESVADARLWAATKIHLWNR